MTVSTSPTDQCFFRIGCLRRARNIPISIVLMSLALVVAGPCASRAAFAQQADAVQVEAAMEAERKRVDDAVVRALEYLAEEQQPSGAWKLNNSGDATAATSLAIMAFLAAGHVPGEGPYGDRIDRGIRWVVSRQQPNGMLVAERGHGPMYSHGIATLMLAEVAGMTGEEEAKANRAALEKAIKLILDAQSVKKNGTHSGGWRYQPHSNDSDLSVTAWQLMALRAAKNIGCDVPAENIDRAVEYVKRLAVPGTGGFGYQSHRAPSPTRAGTGILALEICGKHRTEEALAAAEYLDKRPLEYGTHYYFYGAYYCTVGMFQIGGKHWETMRDRVVTDLIENQKDDGSWESKGGGERSAGRIYCTSMAVLALAVEYRYLPIYQR